MRYLHEKDDIFPHSPEIWRRTQADRLKLLGCNNAWILAGVSAPLPKQIEYIFLGCSHLLLFDLVSMAEVFNQAGERPKNAWK